MTDLWQIDPELGEALQPREREIAEQVTALITRGVQEQYAKHGRPALRDVHSRAHGCVRADFRVEASLPSDFEHGVFVPGATYPAWVRFSNGASDVTRSDLKGDARGMAIKLLNVPGEKILPHERSATTQDFIFLNSPIFMACDSWGYLTFLERQNGSNPIARFFAAFALGIKGALIGINMLRSRIGNPLTIRYWSTVPFQLGVGEHKQAVKFSVVPQAPAERAPVLGGSRFLRERMSAYLKVHEAKFDFYIQPRTLPSMSVEDSRVEWSEVDAPPYKVATITIPKQDFAVSTRDAIGERLAFNPWHALPEHRPLGSINRTRRVVYDATSELRRHLNGASVKEPTDVPDIGATTCETAAAMPRDESRDGVGNRIETFVLTHFSTFWTVIQRVRPLARLANKMLINRAIDKIPTRPFQFSLMTLDPCVPDTNIPKLTDTYSSWDSLNDRRYTGRHLPPAPAFNVEENLPKLEDLAALFRKKNGRTIFSAKSTLLFPYWVQWFTDGFLRTDRTQRLRNTSNHQIDLCPVYGLTPVQTHMLRSMQGGRLKSQQLEGEEYPPFYYGDPELGTVKPEFDGLYVPLNDETRLPASRKKLLFAMGVERANIQPGYVMFNTLCLREHNRLAALLAKSYPGWDDERLFQTARNILIAEIMKIVVEEYINHIAPYNFKFICDPSSFQNEKWYRQNWMSVEFSLVYRWHSALPETLLYGGETLPMEASLWNNQMLISRGLGPMFEETSAQPATRIGLFNTADFLIKAAELPSIELGRKAQLASYNDYREMCKFPRVTDFNQITSDPDAQRELKRLYGHVDNIEFYVGLYAEDVRENSALPALIGRLIGIDAFSQALTNPLLASHIFSEQTFSPAGWKILQRPVTLADLVNRNTSSTSKRYNVTFYREPVKSTAV